MTTEFSRMTQLVNSELALVWRRVEDLDESEALLERNEVHWDAIARECHSARLFDAESVLFGAWVQDPADMQQNRAASADYESSEMIFNPASELIISPAERDIERISSVIRANFSSEPNIFRTEISNELSFLDTYGNVFTFASPRRAPRGLTPLLFNASLRSRSGTNPIIGLRRTVSDLQRSVEYYRDVIEMRSLEGSSREPRFASGLCNFSLVREDYVGTLSTLRAVNRLLPEWIVLCVEDIEATLQELQAKNVSIPRGIENTRYGPLIHILDPDGHSVVFWQQYAAPPDGETDVRPFVRRIIERSRAAQGRAEA
jgi:predicted enzyme related to lactoylglutathione lyase